MKESLLLPAVLVLLILSAACGENPDGERRAVENIARTLQNEVANQVEVPDRIERNIDAGASSWESSFTETSIRSSNGSTTREFSLTVRNKASSPQKFGATIRYFDRNRNELRTRTVREFIIPPYAETTLRESTSMPDRLSMQVDDSIAEVEVLPWDEDPSS